MDKVLLTDSQLALLREAERHPIAMPSTAKEDILYLYGQGLVCMKSHYTHTDDKVYMNIHITERGRQVLMLYGYL